jgi:CheY-like chemotaxis protein
MSKSISVSCLYESCVQADTKSAPAFAQALLLVMFGPAMPATPIRILLADDHGVVRNGFRMLLAAQWDMEVVGEASNGREAVELAEKLAPDVIVMDVTMPELNGIEAARQITKALPKTRFPAPRARRSPCPAPSARSCDRKLRQTFQDSKRPQIGRTLLYSSGARKELRLEPNLKEMIEIHRV